MGRESPEYPASYEDADTDVSFDFQYSADDIEMILNNYRSRIEKTRTNLKSSDLEDILLAFALYQRDDDLSRVTSISPFAANKKLSEALAEFGTEDTSYRFSDWKSASEIVQALQMMDDLIPARLLMEGFYSFYYKQLIAGRIVEGMKPENNIVDPFNIEIASRIDDGPVIMSPFNLGIALQLKEGIRIYCTGNRDLTGIVLGARFIPDYNAIPCDERPKAAIFHIQSDNNRKISEQVADFMDQLPEEGKLVLLTYLGFVLSDDKDYMKAKDYLKHFDIVSHDRYERAICCSSIELFLTEIVKRCPGERTSISFNWDDQSRERVISQSEFVWGPNTHFGSDRFTGFETVKMSKITEYVRKGSIVNSKSCTDRYDKLRPGYLHSIDIVMNPRVRRTQLKTVLSDGHFLAEENSILLTSRSPAANRAYLVKKSILPCIPDQTFTIIKPKENCNPVFLTAFLHSAYFDHQYESIILGTDGDLTVKSVSDLDVPAADSGQQKKIADEFSKMKRSNPEKVWDLFRKELMI